MQNIYCFVYRKKNTCNGTYVATKELMMNMTKKRRGDWLASRLVLGLMDLRRPKASRCSTLVLFSNVSNVANVQTQNVINQLR